MKFPFCTSFEGENYLYILYLSLCLHFVCKVISARDFEKLRALRDLLKELKELSFLETVERTLLEKTIERLYKNCNITYLFTIDNVQIFQQISFFFKFYDMFPPPRLSLCVW